MVTHVPGVAYTAVTTVRTADALVLLTRFVDNFVCLQDRCYSLVSKKKVQTHYWSFYANAPPRQHTHPDDMNCAFVHIC